MFEYPVKIGLLIGADGNRLVLMPQFLERQITVFVPCDDGDRGFKIEAALVILVNIESKQTAVPVPDRKILWRPR